MNIRLRITKRICNNIIKNMLTSIRKGITISILHNKRRPVKQRGAFLVLVNILFSLVK